MSDTGLTCTDLVVAYPDGDDTLTVLDTVSLRIDPGEVVAVTGPSGSGKSTLLAVAGLLRRPDSGEVTIAGTSTTGLKASALARLRSEHIGLVFQSANLFSSLTALEQVELVAHIGGRLDSAARARARDLLGTLGLGGRLDNRPAQLSGGERQRVALARALMMEPSVLLADEPTAALDEARGIQIMELLSSQATERNIATMIVTHASDQLAAPSRRLHLSGGRLDELSPTGG
jgi:putative ABC transport system ATP-binding protein